METAPTFVAMAKAAARSLLPITRPTKPAGPSDTLNFTIKPASERLVDEYMKWAGASIKDYDQTLPPHFCSHWAMAPLATLGSMASYDVRHILNQGLRLQIRAPILRGETLFLRGRLESVTEEPHRVRIHSRLAAFTTSHTDAIIIDNYTAIPLSSKPPKLAGQKTEISTFRTIGHWAASANAGLEFGLVTGDYNPIHTVKAIGKRSAFGGCILQGFGTFARSYEILYKAGFDICDIEVRFLKPLRLPTPLLEVQIAETPDPDQRRAFRLRHADGSLLLAGSFLTRQSATA